MFIAIVSTISLQAQEYYTKGLKVFIDDIHSQTGEFDSSIVVEDDGIIQSSYISQDDEAYYNWAALLDKYDIFFAEEIFEMSLIFNIRENEEQKALFFADSIALYVHDNSYLPEVQISVLQNVDMPNILRMVNEEGMDIAMIEDGVEKDVMFVSPEQGMPCASTKRLDNGAVVLNEEVTVHPDIPGDISLAMFDYYMPRIQQLEEEKRAGNEEHSNIDNEIETLRKEWKAEAELIHAEIAKLAEPAFVELPCTGEHYVATPLNTTRGLYDWINSTGFNKGANGENGQLSDIITPEDVLLYYIVKHTPKEQWLVDGYSATMKAIFIQSVDGGTPAYLYRKSTDEEGYTAMKTDLEQFFYLQEGNTYRGMKVTQRLDVDGRCFIQLYGNRNTILVYDSPADKYCQMDIVVGGIGGFNTAANDCMIGGERELAKRCNIIVGCNGIRVVEGEYESNGVVYSNGVHFESDYWDKFKK